MDMRLCAGARIFVLGKLTEPAANVQALVERSGASLVTRMGSSPTHTVVAHGAADTWRRRRMAGELVSEVSFKRALGLLAPPPLLDRPFTTADVAALAKLDAGSVRDLTLFDLLDPVDERFSFSDLACAREARRLLSGGISIDEVCSAGARLRDRGLRLTEGRLCGTSWGALAVRDAERAGGLDGQLWLDLDEAPAWADGLFAEAELAEENDELEQAESLYRQAMQADRQDPAIPFNLGNVLQRLGRPEEAISAFLAAIKRDPACADAFYNMAILRGQRGQIPEAERCYRATLGIEPGHVAAMFNLALLLTRAERYEEALPFWDQLTSLDGDRQDALRARRSAQLCRMAVHAGRQTS
jgi:tetratricopeptide (TPR) repeat protein